MARLKPPNLSIQNFKQLRRGQVLTESSGHNANIFNFKTVRSKQQQSYRCLTADSGSDRRREDNFKEDRGRMFYSTRMDVTSLASPMPQRWP